MYVMTTNYDNIISNMERGEDKNIPIFMIDNVSVVVNLRKMTNEVVLLRIHSFFSHSTLYWIQFSNDISLTKFFAETIHKLKYNKLIEKLQVTIDNGFIHNLINLIPTNDNILYDFGECSVCLDNTNCKTNCNHFICLSCETQLHIKATSTKTTKKCPMCRSSSYLPYYTDCDSDEEDDLERGILQRDLNSLNG